MLINKEYLISNKKRSFIFLVLLGLGIGACSERDYPEEVGEGVARLSVYNLASLLQGTKAIPIDEAHPECSLVDFQVVEGKTTIIEAADGYGTVIVSFSCDYDFGSQGSKVSNEGGVGETTYFGKVHVTGVKKLSGLLTGNKNTPVIPSGADSSMSFEFSSITFENYRVESLGRKEAMTMISAKVGFNMNIHLAKSCDSDLCKIPLPNPTLTNIRYQEKSIVSLPGPRGIFEAEVNHSDFAAQVGEHEGSSNQLSGTITVWGNKVKVPKTGSNLDPDYKNEDYQKSLLSLKNLKQPVERSCNYEKEIVDVTSRLTVHNLGYLFERLVGENQASVDGRPECQLASRALKPEWEMADPKNGKAVWRFKDCEYRFDDSRFSGTVIVSGSRSAFGRVTQSSTIPIELEKPELHFSFENIRFVDLVVRSDLAKKARLDHVSGQMSAEVVVHLETRKIAGKMVPVRPMPNLTFKKISYLGTNKVNLFLNSGKLQAELSLNIQGSDLVAQEGEFENNKDSIEGKIHIFDKWIELDNHDLKHDYTSGDRKEKAEENTERPTEKGGFDSNQENLPPKPSEQAIRNFFSEVLIAPRSERLGSPNDQFRATLIKHHETLFWIVREPDLISKAGIPRELETWILPFTTDAKDASAENFKEILIAAGEEDVSHYRNAIEKGIGDFQIQGFEGLLSIQIPDGLGTYFKTFLQNVLKEYFPQLDIIDKKRIFVSLLTNTDSKSTEVDRLMAIVYASGPFFQKLMQLLSDKLEPGPMKEALATLKSKLPSIHPDDVDHYLRELVKEGIDLEILRSLGAASVGEAFLARQKLSNKESRLIVIKFMRPGIQEIAERENTFFTRQASLISETMRISFAQISKQIFDELDLRTELRNLERAVAVYNDVNPDPEDLSSNIVTVKPISGFPESKYWMAMAFADGKTLRDSRGILNDPKMSKRRAKVELMAKAYLMDALVRKFVRKSLFPEPDGYFHGDLHGGNTIVSISSEIDEILDKKGITAETLTKEHVRELLKYRKKGGKEPLIKMILIDFGNSHELPHHDRLALFNLLISAADISMSPEAFLKGVQELSHNQQTLDIQALSKKIAPLYTDIAVKFGDKIGRSIDILQQNDVFVPGILVAYYRSIDLLGNSFAQLREDAAAQNICLWNLKMESGLTDEIVSGILAKLPSVKDFLLYGSWPEILSPENVAAMKPNLWTHAKGYYGAKYIWGSEPAPNENANLVCEMAW